MHAHEEADHQTFGSIQIASLLPSRTPSLV
jgi:hypothetical protein